MNIPAPRELLERVRSLPAGGPLLERLQNEGGVYLVGGAVRDLLLGGAPLDLDLVAEGDATDLADRLGGAIVHHERFGTFTVRLEGFVYDIAQARREHYPSPGALPEVTPASLSEDLLRRDFTVNAIAIALAGEEGGMVRAAPDALEDLDRRWLRVLHPESFREDPTRLLRLARYHARLGFEVESASAELARTAVADRALRTVSGPRIGTEVRLLSREPDPLVALRALAELGLDVAIHPRFGLRDSDQDLGRRALALLPAGARRDRLVLALAARRVPASQLRQLLDDLAFEAADRDAIVAVAAGGEPAARTLAAARRPSQIAAAAAGLPLELVAAAGALGAEHAARQWIEALRHVRLQIDGADLLEAGLPEGPAIGRGLGAALEAKLDGRAPDRQAELAAALEGARAAG